MMLSYWLKRKTDQESKKPKLVIMKEQCFYQNIQYVKVKIRDLLKSNNQMGN